MNQDNNVVNGPSELDALFASIQQHSLSLEQASHAVSDSAAHLDSLLHDPHHAPIPEHEHTTARAETEELNAALTAGGHDIGDILLALHHGFVDVISTANTGRDTLAHSEVFGELTSFTSEAEHALATASSQVQAALHSTEQTIRGFNDGIAELEARAQAWIEHSAVLVQDLAIHIRQTYSENLDRVSSAGSLSLEQQVPQHLELARASFASTLTGFTDRISQLGSQLAADIQHTMGEVGESTRSTFQASVETAIEDLMRNELQRLIEDIGLQTPPWPPAPK